MDPACIDADALLVNTVYSHCALSILMSVGGCPITVLGAVPLSFSLCILLTTFGYSNFDVYFRHSSSSLSPPPLSFPLSLSSSLSPPLSFPPLSLPPLSPLSLFFTLSLFSLVFFFQSSWRVCSTSSSVLPLSLTLSEQGNRRIATDMLENLSNPTKSTSQ